MLDHRSILNYFANVVNLIVIANYGKPSFVSLIIEMIGRLIIKIEVLIVQLHTYKITLRKRVILWQIICSLEVVYF